MNLQEVSLNEWLSWKIPPLSGHDASLRRTRNNSKYARAELLQIVWITVGGKIVIAASYHISRLPTPVVPEGSTIDGLNR